MESAGILALAVHFPKGLRTNEYWRNHHPDVLLPIEAKKNTRVWKDPEANAGPKSDFDIEMERYLSDPFRGTVERRVITADESALTLELAAAKKVLAAAGMSPGDVDCMIVTSFLPDHFGCMDAPYLARRLGLKGLAFNLESACSSAMIGLHTACALVQSGQYRNVLLVSSCTYSRDMDTRMPISWNGGDGAGAFIVGKVERGYGRLGGECVHTGETCEALWFENYVRDNGSLWFRLVSSADAGKVIRDVSEMYLLRCCRGALADAGVTLDQIDHFVFNTPLAWYAKFCARTLGVDPNRPIIDMYPKYANTGPVLLPGNLYHAAREMPFKKGDLVLMYSVGSISSAGAMVLRWGDVALGPDPEPAEIVCD